MCSPKSGLSNLIDASLCLFSSIEGLDKSQPDIFLLARDRAALPATRCVFVGEDSAERTVAASVGFRVSPTHFTLYTSSRPSSQEVSDPHPMYQQRCVCFYSLTARPSDERAARKEQHVGAGNG
jgi:hypothetical protein